MTTTKIYSKKIDTTNTTSQDIPISGTESLLTTNETEKVIRFHKISKTGKLEDLLNKPFSCHSNFDQSFTYNNNVFTYDISVEEINTHNSGNTKIKIISINFSQSNWAANVIYPVFIYKYDGDYYVTFNQNEAEADDNEYVVDYILSIDVTSINGDSFDNAKTTVPTELETSRYPHYNYFSFGCDTDAWYGGVSLQITGVEQ